MIWQDMVFGIGTVIFFISLLPSMLNKNTKIPLLTSLPTFLVLYAFCYAYITLQLYFGAVAAFLTASAWLFIALFRRA